MGRQTAQQGRFGYASRHLLVSRDRPAGPGDEVGYDPTRSASVQLRTVLQHAWAEFEHDIRYKGTVPAEHLADAADHRVRIPIIGSAESLNLSTAAAICLYESARQRLG